jgi:hypothetical protein
MVEPINIGAQAALTKKPAVAVSYQGLKEANRGKRPQLTQVASVCSVALGPKTFDTKHQICRIEGHPKVLMFADQDEPEPLREKMTRNQHISSFLNSPSTFLYMTNYYICLSIGILRSGSHGRYHHWYDAKCGLGRNNYSLWMVVQLFIQTCLLLFAATSALALHNQSLTMAMVGHFLNGLVLEVPDPSNQN